MRESVKTDSRARKGRIRSLSYFYVSRNMISLRGIDNRILYYRATLNLYVYGALRSQLLDASAIAAYAVYISCLAFFM